MSPPRLDPRLARLFAAVVLGRWTEVERLRREAPPGEPDRGWREAFLQSHLFAGFPRADADARLTDDGAFDLVHRKAL